MDNSPKVVVDYLNIRVVFLLLKLPYPSPAIVYFLFRRKNLIFERLLIFFLKLNGFIAEYKKFSAVKSYKKHTELADRVTQLALNRLKKDTSLESFFIKRIGNYVIWDIYRAVSIIEFINSDKKLKDIEKIYISQKRYVDDLISCTGADKFRFYSSFGGVNDSDCQVHHKSKINLFFSSIKEIIFSIIKLLMIYPRKWPSTIKLEGILILHPDILERKYYSNQVLLNQLSNFGLIKNNLILNVKNKNYPIRRLSYGQFFPFFNHIFKGINLFFPIQKLLFKEKVFLLRDWANVFFVREMIRLFNCSFIYSSYETYDSLLVLHCANLSKDCVSLAATFSFGYFVQKHEFSHQVKNVDVYFVWGQAQIELFKATGDVSQNYVISGYLGSSFFREFIELSNKNFSNITNPIITYFDASIADDLYYDMGEAMMIVGELAKISSSMNAKLVIKTKKDAGIYDNLILQYPNNIIITSGRANLSASVRADIVIGYLFSSPALIAGTQGKNVLFYDPNSMLWDEFYNSFSKVIVNSIDDLKNKIGSILTESGNDAIENHRVFNSIDKFADDKAQIRIGEYINYIIDNKKLGKEDSLEIANEKYSKIYGKDCIETNSIK